MRKIWALSYLTDQIKDKITRHKNLDVFLDELEKQEGLVSEFAPLLWNNLVDYVTVYENENIKLFLRLELRLKPKKLTLSLSKEQDRVSWRKIDFFLIKMNLKVFYMMI